MTWFVRASINFDSSSVKRTSGPEYKTDAAKLNANPLRGIVFKGRLPTLTFLLCRRWTEAPIGHGPDCVHRNREFGVATDSRAEAAWFSRFTALTWLVRQA